VNLLPWVTWVSAEGYPTEEAVELWQYRDGIRHLPPSSFVPVHIELQ
jgi:hypothetical protein